MLIWQQQNYADSARFALGQGGFKLEMPLSVQNTCGFNRTHDSGFAEVDSVHYLNFIEVWLSSLTPMLMLSVGITYEMRNTLTSIECGRQSHVFCKPSARQLSPGAALVYGSV